MAIGGALLAGAGITIIIRAVDQFSGVFKKATIGTNALGTAMKVGATAAIAAGVAIAAIGVAAVKTAMSFESAFAGVRKTVELSEEDFAKLEQKFKDITATVPITFEEISKIGELAGQLGVEGVANIEKFTKTIADISVTTNLTAEQAATDFARIANIMQEPIDNVDRMGATVVELGNNFATTEMEITSFAERLAGAGKIVGLTTDEVFAIGAALSSVGVEAEAGGTAVQTALLLMNESVTSGNAALGVFASTAGMSADEFSKMWETDASQAFERFILGLGEQGDNASLILDEVGLGAVRTSRSFLSLSNAGDLISQTLGTASSAWEKNTALTIEANKRYETFASQVKILGNQLQLLIEPLGKQLIPVLLDLFKVLKDDIFPVIEPLIPLIGEFLTNALNSVVPILPKLTASLTRIIEVFMKLFDALLPLMEPLMDIGFILLDAIMDAIEPLIPMIAALTRIFKPLLEILAPIVKFLGMIIGFIADLAGGLGSGVWNTVGDLFGLPKSNKNSSTGSNSNSTNSPQSNTSSLPVIKLNDFIIQPNSQDTIIGTKNPNSMGGITIIIEGNIYGTDPDEIVEALANKIGNTIKL